MHEEKDSLSSLSSSFSTSYISLSSSSSSSHPPLPPSQNDCQVSVELSSPEQNKEDVEEEEEEEESLDNFPQTDLKPPSFVPWGPVLIIFLITISDALVLSLIAPFIPDMCENVFGVPQRWVGAATGLITGAFSFAQFLSGFSLGHASDHFGRKPLLLMGSFTAAIGVFFFGVSPLLSVAVLNRFVCGLFNNNMASGKAFIGDVSSGEGRALAFAYQGACFSMSRALASVIAALTTGVYLAGVPVYDSNPYMVACSIGAAFNLVSFFTALFFLHETRGKCAKKPSSSSSSAASSSVADLEMEDIVVSLEKETKDSLTGGSSPLESLLSEEKAEEEERKSWLERTREKMNNNDFVKGTKQILSNPTIRRLQLIFFVNSFTNGSITVAMTLLFSLPVEDHGLGFSPQKVGIIFAYFGFVSVMIQLVGFKRMYARFGAVRLYSAATICFSGSSLAMPLVVLIYWMFGRSLITEICVWFYLVIVVTFTGFGFMTGMPILGNMLSNCSDQNRQGLTMGITQSGSAFLRALGPLVSGLLFSVSVMLSFPFLLFIVLGLMYLACFFINQGFSPDQRLVLEGKAAPSL